MPRKQRSVRKLRINRLKREVKSLDIAVDHLTDLWLRFFGEWSQVRKELHEVVDMEREPTEFW